MKSLNNFPTAAFPKIWNKFGLKIKNSNLFKLAKSKYKKVEYSPTHLSGVIRKNATHAKNMFLIILINKKSQLSVYISFFKPLYIICSHLFIFVLPHAVTNFV